MEGEVEGEVEGSGKGRGGEKGGKDGNRKGREGKNPLHCFLNKSNPDSMQRGRKHLLYFL